MLLFQFKPLVQLFKRESLIAPVIDSVIDIELIIFLKKQNVGRFFINHIHVIRRGLMNGL